MLTKLGLLFSSQIILQDLMDTNLHNEVFPYSTSKLVKVAGHLCRVLRISYVGELGWEVHIPWDSCSAVYKAIWQQGNKHGLRHAGFRALHSLSCEKGENYALDLTLSSPLMTFGIMYKKID